MAKREYDKEFIQGLKKLIDVDKRGVKAELGRILDISPQAINKFLGKNPTSYPSEENKWKIAEYLGLSPEAVMAIGQGEDLFIQNQPQDDFQPRDFNKEFNKGLLILIARNKTNQRKVSLKAGINYNGFNQAIKKNLSVPELSKWKLAAVFNLTPEEVMAIGRGESITNSPKPEKQNTLTEDEIRKIVREEQQGIASPIDITVERHRQLLDKFKQKELALKIIELLVEIEDMNMETLKDAVPVLKLLKIQAEQEAQKKRPAINGDD